MAFSTKDIKLLEQYNSYLHLKTITSLIFLVGTQSETK